MASAFSNNTANLTSSERTSNSKAKTNYNYLRLVSLKNVDNLPRYVGCKNKRFSSSSGNVILGLDDSVINEQRKNQPPSFNPPSRTSELALSKLVNTRSYDLRNSINKGFYLPTTIPKNNTTNDNINRPPYTYDPSCKTYFTTQDETIISYTQPNTSGDLQEILFNEYLDFGDATLVTNTQFVTEDTDFGNIPFKTMYPNQVQVTDASFGDYIIDPDNIVNNYKDSELPTYLGLQNATVRDSDGKEKILKIINWRKLQINTFPNNKYHRFSINEPIKFYNYDACVNPLHNVPPSDIDKSDIKSFGLGGTPAWSSGKTSANGAGSATVTGDRNPGSGLGLDIVNDKSTGTIANITL